MGIERLGRYRILDERGRHATGRILGAHDEQRNRAVVIRTVERLGGLPESEQATASERFLAQARALAGLGHPHLLPVVDAGESGDLLYVVNDAVDGIPLETFCRSDRLLPIDTVLELVAGAADGLDEAHRAFVIHGDLRPASLLRVADRRAQVAEFGLTLPETATAKLLATAGYAAPERIRGRAGEARSDLFSLAAVLYELLTGTPPFSGNDESSVLYRTVHEDPPEPTREHDPLHPELAAILSRGLAKLPDERFQSGAELAAALRAAAVEVSVDARLGGPDAPLAGEPAEHPQGEGGEPSAVAPPARRAPARTALAPFVVGAFVLVVVAAAAYLLFGDGLPSFGPPEPVWWEAAVRTEPAGLAVTLDGEPLEPPGRVRFPAADAAPAILATRLGCRTVEHRLSAEDAGGEVVLVIDPVEMAWQFDPAVAGASVTLNGEAAGSAPLELTLDLCRDNRIEVAATGHRDAVIEIEAGVTPLDARKQLYALALEAIPRGRLVLPDSSIELVYYVDGRRLGRRERELELEEGEYELRYKNEYHFIDRRTTVRIAGGAASSPELPGIELASLVVQAFPANCKVYVRRPGGAWRYVDETPATRKVALGRYEVKVVLNPTGESRIEKIELRRGENPPLRVSFGRPS